MSYHDIDGMPKSYDAWRTQSPPDEDHHKDCPANEDQEWPADERGIAVEPDCKCAELVGDGDGYPRYCPSCGGPDGGD